jgi:hypothetical protein
MYLEYWADDICYESDADESTCARHFRLAPNSGLISQTCVMRYRKSCFRDYSARRTEWHAQPNSVNAKVEPCPGCDSTQDLAAVHFDDAAGERNFPLTERSSPIAVMDARSVRAWQKPQ